MARRKYSNTAVATNLIGTIASDTLALSVVNASGYPTAGAFTIRIDRDQASEEILLISQRSGTTFTVDPAGRGFDGTTPAIHANGATVELVAIAAQRRASHARRGR
jgi:hypothetical protein